MLREQSGGTNPSDTKMMSIEELRTAQAKKDNETEEAKRQKAAEEQHQKDLKARTETDMEPREAALAELKLSQAEIDKFKAERIEERIANSEKLKEDEKTKEEELQRIQQEFEEISKQIQEIQSLIEGKKEEEVAGEVKTALAELKKKSTSLEKSVKDLTGELGKIKAEQVSDVQVQRYQKLQERMDALNTQVANIEANPYMIERLFAEAKTENEMRDVVVREALGGVRRNNKKEVELMSEVVQRFLTEEFQARGFDKIKDPKEREKAIREFTEAVASGVGGGADHGTHDYGRLKKGEQVGFLLKNLVGKHGSMAGTEGWFRLPTSGWSDEKRNSPATGNYIKQHLGSLNLLRAYSTGLKTYHGAILGTRFSEHDWKQFDTHIYAYKLSAQEGRPLIPEEADKASKDKILAEFQKNLKAAKDWEKQTVEAEKKQLTADISVAEAEVQKAETALSDAQTAQNQIDSMRRENIYSLDDAKRKLAQVNKDISDSESRLAEAQAKLDKLGFLAFNEKSSLKAEISRINYNLTTYNGLREQKGKLEKVVKAFEARKVWDAEKKVNEAKQNLAIKKNRLADLNKVRSS